MKSINELSKSEASEQTLKKEFYKALKDEEFIKLVNKLGVTEDVASRYTSKLEMTVQSLRNCSKCKSLEECKNPVNGCVLYPFKDENLLRFDYVACKYKKKFLNEEKLKPIELVIEKTFKRDFDIKYNKEANHRTHMTDTLNRRLKQAERSILPNKIKAEQYHIEIIEKEEKTIINIYNEKNDLSLDLKG